MQTIEQRAAENDTIEVLVDGEVVFTGERDEATKEFNKRKAEIKRVSKDEVVAPAPADVVRPEELGRGDAMALDNSARHAKAVARERPG